MPHDEAALLADASRAEAALASSPLVERDPELNAYLHAILCRVAQGQCGFLRLYIINTPDFGARTLANGVVEIGSGLVWRAGNEAQFAFILGREVAHYSQHHALEASRAEQRGHAALLVADLAAASLGVYLASDLIDLGLGGAVRGLAANREREADRVGLDLLVAAHYDGAEAVAISNALAGEARVGRQVSPSQHQDRDLDRAAPTTHNRLSDLRKRVTGPNEASPSNDAYRDRIRSHLAAWLAGDLDRHDYSASIFAFDRLTRAGRDLGLIDFYRGEAYRLRRRDGDLAQARTAYLEAVRYDDVPALAWRQLGELDARDNRIAEAREAFETYLERAPNAEDRALVQAQLDDLSRP
jgi:predicted Zn-dependent protease